MNVPKKRDSLGFPELIRVLVVAGDQGIQKHIRGMLADSLYATSFCGDSSEARMKLSMGFKPHIILLDLFDCGESGITVLQQMRADYPQIRFIATSCSYLAEDIIGAMKAGARQVLLSPFSRTELIEAIENNVARRTQNDNHDHGIALEGGNRFVFASDRMKEIRAQSALVARVDLPVLILGESGTGKEVLAKYIHQTSPRATRTFLKVNCAAMPADLLESELFGYEQGAFTGATRSKPGKFELCNEGTMLLDEIGEMPVSLQAKLLHVLQDGTFSRLGGRGVIKVNVRVIAATNIDMKLAIAEKRFREDLYYRIAGFTMSLPPLRERKEEIPAVMNHFVEKLSVTLGVPPVLISGQLLDACMQYDWPGNLRELENFVKRMLVLRDDEMMIAELRVAPRQARPGSGEPMPSAGLKGFVRGLKGTAEIEAISRTLDKTGWNRRIAATELQISYKALLYKIRQYGLEPPQRHHQLAR
jgi:two-component system response regulator AtoC